MFLALPLLIAFEPFRLVGCGFVWCWRFMHWLLTPPRVVWVAFALPWIVVFHVVWFAHGWATFRPLCWSEEGYPRQELMGPMTVEATDAYYDFFVAWLGPDSVRRFGTNQIDVRPALRLMPTDLLWNHSGKVAQKLAAEQGIVDEQGRSPTDCSLVEERVMEGGKAEGYSTGWGYWPYNEFEDFRSPFWRYLVFYHKPGSAP